MKITDTQKREQLLAVITVTVITVTFLFTAIESPGKRQGGKSVFPDRAPNSRRGQLTAAEVQLHTPARRNLLKTQFQESFGANTPDH